MDWERYKWPLITVFMVTIVLVIMLTFGYTIGILSEAPDGLERSLMDSRSESWLEELPTAWEPILSWISNDYVAGILGIFLTLIIILGFFYGLRYIRTRTQESENHVD